MAESKIEKFQRLFSKRMDKVADAMRTIENLTSPNYEIDPVIVSVKVSELEAQWMYIRGKLGLNEVITTPQGIADMDKKYSTSEYNGDGWELMDEAYNSLLEGDVDKAKKLMLQGFSA